MEPAVGIHHLRGGRGVLIVAQHDAAAPDAELAVLGDLILAVVVGLAGRADVLFVLGIIDDAVAAGLGHAIHLGDHHALPGQLSQHLAIKHGGRTAGIPQAVETLPAASLDVFVDGLHQHGSHGHGIAVHQPDIAVEIPQVAGEVEGPALAGPDEQADERAQMEQGQDAEVAQHIVLVLGHVGMFVIQHGIAENHLLPDGGEEVALREHDGLAAASGAGGEHQHHQVIVAAGVGDVHGGLAVLEAVHGAEDGAVSGHQLIPAAIVDAVVQDEAGLHQADLIFQLRPGLFLVQGHDHATRQDDAKGVDAVFIAVFAQQGHPLAFDIRDGTAQISHHTADVLHILGIGLFHHGLAVGGHIAKRHMIRVLPLHGLRYKFKRVIDHSFCSLPFSFFATTRRQLQALPIP